MPPLTEIAQFSLPADDKSIPKFIAAFREAMLLQDEWFATHGAPPGPPAQGPQPATAAEARGAALYVRADGGPRDMLITAHWASIAEHEAWIASPANKAACAHFVAAGLNVGDPDDCSSSPYHGLVHIDGVAAFSPAVMRAPRVGLLRFAVRHDVPRSTFAIMLDTLNVIRTPCEGGGWRVEPFDKGTCDEFVVVSGGWPTAEALTAARTLCVQSLGDYVENCVAHLYERLV